MWSQLRPLSLSLSAGLLNFLRQVCYELAVYRITKVLILSQVNDRRLRGIAILFGQ